MKPIVRNGWEIYFHPLFRQQYQDLRTTVVTLKNNLSEDEYKQHSDVKLFAAIVNIINSIIPSDPFAHYFVLKDELKKYSRVKRKGLPERYRLFFKVFKENSKIGILWLGYPRKQGDKNDCYAVFFKKVSRGEFPENFEDLIALIEARSESDSNIDSPLSE